MPRQPNDDLRRFILERVYERPLDMAELVINTFGGSRVTANNYLRKLAAGVIRAESKTRGRRYTALPTKVVRGKIDIHEGMEDDEDWRTHIRPAIKEEYQNIIDICAFGFTKMFSNVIDPSESSSAFFAVET